MSIIPIASAAQLLPAALVAGKVATQAVGSFAGMLREAISSPPHQTSQVSKASSPEGLSSLLRDFAAGFRQLLQNRGLDSGPGLQLRLGEQGDVEVAGDHPQGSAIQNLLAQTPRLSELFRSIAAKATAHRKDQEFAAFQKNPRGGTEDFPLLFSNERAPKFQMVLHGETATTAFV